jgi:NlpC/P60 family putative phage cell wall peptidase
MEISVKTNKVLATARTWLGTPFHHQARVRGKGCDCLGLIIGVARELDLRDENGVPIASYDDPTYARTPNGTVLVNLLSQIFDSIKVTDADLSDIGLFSIEDNLQHLGIISDYEGGLGIIHSLARRGVVEKGYAMQKLLNKRKLREMGLE